MTGFADEVQSLRPQLLRFARLQLRNDAWAEDAVSETLLAALEKPQAFGGQAQLKTWLIGILKHKLVDELRRQRREATLLTRDDDEDVDALWFDAGGAWTSPPADWGNPEHCFAERQFFEVLELCVDRLPATQGRVFLMREWLELGSDEICRTLAISSANLWVLLHRARLRLRDCLQAGWFDGRERGAGRQA